MFLDKLRKSVERLVALGAARPRKAAADSRRFTQAASRNGAQECIGDRCTVQRIGPLHFVVDEVLGERRNARHQRRRSASQRLKRGQAEAFEQRRHRQHVGDPIERRHFGIGQRAGQHDRLAATDPKTSLGRLSPKGRGLGTVVEQAGAAGHHELRARKSLPQVDDCLQQPARVLARLDAAHRQHHGAPAADAVAPREL